MSAKELSAKEVAEKIGTDAKTLRVFLRAERRGVGAGKKYVFKASEVASLKKRFIVWQKEREEARKAREAQAAAENAAAATPDDVEDTTPDED